MSGIIFIFFLIVFMGIVRSLRDRQMGRTPPARMPQSPPAEAPADSGYGDWEEERETIERQRTAWERERGHERDGERPPELRQLARELLSRAQELGTMDAQAAGGAGGYPLESYPVPPPEGVDMHPSHQRYRAAAHDPIRAEEIAEAGQTQYDPYGVYSLGEESLERAVVLREVLGPPVSRRKR